MNFKEINPKDLDIKSIYHLLISGVSPRPIALVGSIDKRVAILLSRLVYLLVNLKETLMNLKNLVFQN